MLRNKLFPILALLILSPLILAVAYYAGPSTGYIKFTIELYDDKGRRITGPLGIPTVPGNLKILAQVYALTPPNSGDVVVEVFRGEVKGGSLTLYPKGRLGEIAEAWVRFEKSRRVDPEYSSVGLELNLWVVEEGTGRVLQRVSYFYPYSPKGLLVGEKLEYPVKIAVDVSQAGGGNPSNICWYEFEWRLKYSVEPEDKISVFGDGNVKYHNGAWYVKLTILTIYNKLYYYSGVIDSSIGMSFERKTEAKVAIGIGFQVEKKLKNGDITGGLSGKVYLGGSSRSLNTYGFWVPDSIGGGEWAHVWIWARPVMLFYNEYRILVCEGAVISEEYTGHDKIEFLIQDIIVEYVGIIGGKKAYRIIGGVSYSPPPGYILDWLFDDSMTKDKYIWLLGSNEGILFKYLIPQTIDTCTADFEISLGIVLAGVLRLIGLPHFAALAVMIAPSLSYGESETLYIEGGIENEGPYSEYLHIRLSKLQFRKDPPWWAIWEDPCYYNPPVSMYIEAR